MRDHGLDRSLTDAQKSESAALMQRMAKAAGETQPAVMIHACFALMQIALMVANPDAYIEWKTTSEGASNAR